MLCFAAGRCSEMTLIILTASENSFYCWKLSIYAELFEKNGKKMSVNSSLEKFVYPSVVFHSQIQTICRDEYSQLSLLPRDITNYVLPLFFELSDFKLGGLKEENERKSHIYNSELPMYISLCSQIIEAVYSLKKNLNIDDKVLTLYFSNNDFAQFQRMISIFENSMNKLINKWTDTWIEVQLPTCFKFKSPLYVINKDCPLETLRTEYIQNCLKNIILIRKHLLPIDFRTSFGETGRMGLTGIDYRTSFGETGRMGLTGYETGSTGRL